MSFTYYITNDFIVSALESFYWILIRLSVSNLEIPSILLVHIISGGETSTKGTAITVRGHNMRREYFWFCITSYVVIVIKSESYIENKTWLCWWWSYSIIIDFYFGTFCSFFFLEVHLLIWEFRVETINLLILVFSGFARWCHWYTSIQHVTLVFLLYFSSFCNNRWMSILFTNYLLEIDLRRCFKDWVVDMKSLS